MSPWAWLALAILLAWVLIYQGGEERRVRRLSDRREG